MFIINYLDFASQVHLVLPKFQREPEQVTGEGRPDPLLPC